MIVDYGGRVEDLVLKSHSTGDLRKTLLTHDDNATAVLENKWWKGMILLPWANRIAYVSCFEVRLSYHLSFYSFCCFLASVQCTYICSFTFL